MDTSIMVVHISCIWIGYGNLYYYYDYSYIDWLLGCYVVEDDLDIYIEGEENMSMIGIVFGSICLMGACKYAKIWWSMNDDKAGLWALGLGVLAVINFWGSF